MSKECPPEALVLLDEALEQPGIVAHGWPRPGLYQGPHLDNSRCCPGTPTAKSLPTWTVGCDGYDLLEWWDDHWVLLRVDEDRKWQIVWEGRKLGA